MNRIPSTPIQPQPRTRWHARVATGVFICGLVVALLAIRSLPPAPPFSPGLARASYRQSYETSYFASLRSYEQPIRRILADGNIPVVVFGDSTIRGTGAVGGEVWTRLLEQRLRAANPRVRVLNYAQNAGDLMGPFLYHHLQRKFPQVHYVVQWHFASEVGVRHPFHLWLTSEIALRDGKDNPAVLRSFKTVPVTKWEEQATFVLAAFNMLTNYLDAGNWLRYLWLGQVYQDSDRQVKIGALRDAAEADVTIRQFTPPEESTAGAMRGYFRSFLTMREKYIHTPLADRAAYLAEMYPADQRSRLLLFTLDLNPYYAPHEDPALIETWREIWARLRTDMAQIPDLRWVALSGSNGELEVNDYADLGHLTPSGQRRLANTVAEKLLGPDGWFDPAAAPAAELPPPLLKSQWYETRGLPPDQLLPFSFMRPRPSRFISSFGPALDTIFYNAHPTTRLCFQVPEGKRRMQTTVRLDAGAYEKLPAGEAPTDGIDLEIALLTRDGRRTVVYRRLINPALVTSDRGLVTVDISFDVPADTEVELYVGPGPEGRDTRDWAFIGPLNID